MHDHAWFDEVTFVLPQPPFDPNQPPPPCPPWNSHEGMWNDQRDPGNWSGGPPREGGPWSGPGGSDPGPPAWNSYDQQPPWGNQPEQPPWGQREPPFPPRMQACATKDYQITADISNETFCLMFVVSSYRDPLIFEGPSLHTSSRLPSTSPPRRHTTLDDSLHVLFRMNFLPDTTMTDLHTPPIALTTPREIILVVSDHQLYLNHSLLIKCFS